MILKAPRRMVETEMAMVMVEMVTEVLMVAETAVETAAVEWESQWFTKGR